MNIVLLNRVIIGFLLILLVVACQEKEETAEAVVDRIYQEYELQPTPEKAGVFLDTLDQYIRANIDQKELIRPYLEKGVDVSIAQGILSRTSAYILPLLRLFPDLDQRKERLLSLGDVMHALRKRHASSIIYKELLEKYPSDPQIASKENLIDSIAIAESDYLQYLFNQILINPDEFGVNKAASLKYVDGVEANKVVRLNCRISPVSVARAVTDKISFGSQTVIWKRRSSR